MQKQRASWYNLNHLTKDERKLIYVKLDWVDWTLGKIAHNSHSGGITNKFVSVCVKNGYLEILQYVNAYNSEVYYSSIRFGHLHILEWLSTKFKFNSSLIEDAEIWGHLHIIQWARAQDPPISWPITIGHNAMVSNNSKILKWYIDHDAPIIEWIIEKANEKGLLV